MDWNACVRYSIYIISSQYMNAGSHQNHHLLQQQRSCQGLHASTELGSHLGLKRWSNGLAKLNSCAKKKKTYQKISIIHAAPCPRLRTFNSALARQKILLTQTRCSGSSHCLQTRLSSGYRRTTLRSEEELTSLEATLAEEELNTRGSQQVLPSNTFCKKWSTGMESPRRFHTEAGPKWWRS